MKHKIAAVLCVITALLLDGYIETLRDTKAQNFFIDGAPNLISGLFIPLAIICWTRFNDYGFKFGFGFAIGLMIYEILQAFDFIGIFDINDLVMSTLALILLFAIKVVYARIQNDRLK